MARKTKEFELRMQGMAAAYKIVKDGGVEALEKDIRYRGLTKAPVNVSQAEMEGFISEISENLFVTVKVVSMIVLKNLWSFGNKRLKQFEEEFQKVTKDAMDMDWIGKHYVTLTDYAKYIQEENGIHIDMDVTDRCQRSFDKSNPEYKRVELNRMVAELSQNGFEKAAEFCLERFS